MWTFPFFSSIIFSPRAPFTETIPSSFRESVYTGLLSRLTFTKLPEGNNALLKKNNAQVEITRIIRRSRSIKVVMPEMPDSLKSLKIPKSDFTFQVFSNRYFIVRVNYYAVNAHGFEKLDTLFHAENENPC